MDFLSSSLQIQPSLLAPRSSLLAAKDVSRPRGRDSPRNVTEERGETTAFWQASSLLHTEKWKTIVGTSN